MMGTRRRDAKSGATAVFRNPGTRNRGRRRMLWPGRVAALPFRLAKIGFFTQRRRMSPAFPVASYLARLALPELPPADLDGLALLLQAQARAIAFENLDVLAGRVVELDPQALYDKLLVAGRGGFCFELNGLLALALAHAGFDVRPVMARVTWGRTAPGPATHQALLVQLDGQRYLVDAGFGGPAPTRPLPLVCGPVMDVDGARFRFAADADGDLHLQRHVGDRWSGLYVVSLADTRETDIRAANHFVCRWRGSPFRNRLMVALPRADGLVALQGTDLVRFDAAMRENERQPLEDGEHLAQVLRDRFGLRVDDALANQAWDVALPFASRPAP